MSEEEILTLPCGDALDALIAERIFGREGLGYYGPTKSDNLHTDYERFDTKAEALAKFVEHWKGGTGKQSGADMDEDHISLCYWGDGWGPLRASGYSEDISDAWEIVEALRERGIFLSLHVRTTGYTCEAWRRAAGDRGNYNRVHPHDCFSETASLAICRCALIALLLLTKA